MAAGTEPLVLAMVICDAVWQDAATGKFFLLGVFSSISAKKFPATHPMLAVWFALTDLRGKTPLKLRLVTVDEDAILCEEAGELADVGDPRVVAEIALHLQGVQFPMPGEYRMQLLGQEGALLAERRIMVLQITGDEHDEPNEDAAR